MTKVKYSLIVIFTIALIINAWIFFTSKSEEKISDAEEFELAQNELYQQTPRDNDAEYSMPAYIPTHSQSRPKTKVEFKEGADNDALYSLPVAMPSEPTPTPEPVVTSPVAKAPVKAPVKTTPKVQAQPAQVVQQPAPVETVIPVNETQIQVQTQPVPVAPLQPRARQPETPTYVPEYQQPQYQQPQYEQPVQPQNPTNGGTENPSEEIYPYYYY